MKKLIVTTILISALCTACGGVNNSTKITPTDLSSENKEETLSQNEQIQQTNQEEIVENTAPQDTNIQEKEVENLHPIDKAERDCIAKDYSNANMNSCGYKAMDAWFKEIDKYMTLLKNVTSEEEYANILKAQENWKKYQESEFVAISLIRNKDGTIYQTIAIGNELHIIKERALELQSLYNDLME